MTKKAIIFVILLLFLNSIIFPNFASAIVVPEPSGSDSNVSTGAAVALLVGAVVVLGLGAIYYYKKSSKEPKEDKKENELTKKKVEERITPSGQFILLRW